MNNELFEQLLYEEESTTLDFKRKQYIFSKGTDDEKSELLKDIVGFANAWRRSKAYILIGVEEIRGGQSNVIGIPASDHLDDHSIQQFVNSLTNRPIIFHYEAFGFEGKQVGIISIDEQTRPFYLKKNYGKLLKDMVYVRRGSSTDPTKPALPDEIAQMRIGSVQSAAELRIEFADVERDDALGTNISWDAEYCEMPKSIPDLLPPQNPFGVDLSFIDPMIRRNSNFYRELAIFELMRRLFRPVRLVVRNVGEVVANNVRVELTIPKNICVVKTRLPVPPKRNTGPLNNVDLSAIRPALRREPGEVVVDKDKERFRIEIECRDLQPGRRVWSDIFYIGKKESGDLSLNGVVFADNLPQPKGFTLIVSVRVTKTSLTVDELCSLPEPALR